MLTFTVVRDDWGFTCFYELTTVTPEYMEGTSDCAGNVQDMTCDRTCGD